MFTTLACLAATGAIDAADGARQRVRGGDPFIHLENGTYYLYFSSGDKVGLTVYTSTDLKEWLPDQGRDKFGRAYVNAAERTLGKKWSITTNEVKVNVDGGAQIGQDAIWMIVNPGKIDKTAQVTITAKTEKYDISKTITLTDDMVFPQGNIAVLNLSIAEENCRGKLPARHGG